MLIIFLLLCLTLFACREKFVLPVKSPPAGYLVVEGFINCGPGPTDIKLSRSNIVSDQTIHYETGASVQVEGNDNSVYGLSESGPGIYHSDQLHLSNAQQFRLRIKTTDGHEYLSDFTPTVFTPPIDSVNWTRNNAADGIQIYVNTHDPSNLSRYYKWEYEETWEIHMSYVPKLKYDTINYEYPIPRRILVASILPDSSYYRCWTSDTSASLLLGSSARLSEDIIHNFPLALIPPASVKLSVKYSINVKQYALTKDAYDFLEIMKKNTEETGSIFDPQPSELKGNIHNTNDPSEIIVGYISTSSLQQQRIFISNDQVPNWNYDPQCSLTSISNQDTVKVKQAESAGYIPIMPDAQIPDTIISFFGASPLCADCRKTGFLKKPAFWQ